MNVIKRIVRWPLLAVAIIGIAACDAEVKVATDAPPDSSAGVGEAGGESDSVVTGGGLGDNGGSSDGGSSSGGSSNSDDPGNGNGSNGSSGSSGNNGSNGSSGSNGSGSTPPKQTPPSSSRNIRVSSPKAGDLITSRTFTLRGESRTFENTGSYRLRAANGTVLADGFFTATGEMGTFSPYSTTVQIKSAYTGAAVLEVFQFSAKDGSEIDKVTIPLRVQTAGGSAGGSSVSAFFTNTQKNPGATDCSRVFPAKRSIGSTAAVARAALEELLRGPTSAERAQSFGTEIPSGTRLRDITIDNGVATADFSRELNTAAGSCSVTAARSQIEQTLRQFPTVRRVVIAVEGNTREVLQP